MLINNKFTYLFYFISNKKCTIFEQLYIAHHAMHILTVYITARQLQITVKYQQNVQQFWPAVTDDYCNKYK